MSIEGKVVSTSLNKAGEKTTSIEFKDPLYRNLTQLLNIPGDEFKLGEDVLVSVEALVKARI